MGREVKRVAPHFTWPRGQVWNGFILPDHLREAPCSLCKRGYSAYAEYLFAQWYGHVHFDPAITGSTPLRPDTPAVREFAERNIAAAPEYYGGDERAITLEARRLANLWNGQWCHHLAQEDVDALVAADRLWDFTHTLNKTGWHRIDPPVTPTAIQVNQWSLRGFGHDSFNAWTVVHARCERVGIAHTCKTCEGHGTTERYEGQRAEAEEWKPVDPPAGEGWQLWETVSEGSPISPVFTTAEELARWLTTPAACWGAMRRPLTIDQARGFVRAGWAPTLIATADGLRTGAECAGETEAAKPAAPGDTSPEETP